MKKSLSKLKDNFEVNIDDTINSGQVFLWKKFDIKWYGINGEKTLIFTHFSVFFRLDRQSIKAIKKHTRRCE